MRKIWNRPAGAVWSLSTKSAHGVANLNICTYVTAISLKPKLMLVGVYEGTQTLENIQVGDEILLQLLTEELAPVVKICGRQSGRQVDKVRQLEKKFALSLLSELYYFVESAGIILLKVEQLVPTSGDHVLMVGLVIKSKNFSDKRILTTDYLRAKKLIR